jgi:hypothetical protein
MWEDSVKVDIFVPVLNLAPRNENLWRGGGTAPQFLTFALNGCEWSASRLGHFNPRKREHGTYWTVVGCRSGRCGIEKMFCLCRESTPADQPVARRYTNRAIPVHR